MYLPQMSYHPLVFVYCIRSKEKQLKLCIVAYTDTHLSGMHSLYLLGDACRCIDMCLCVCVRYVSAYKIFPSGMCSLPCVHVQGVQ